MIPYITIGSLVIANHSSPTDYVLRSAAFPAPAMRSEIAAALEAGGTPSGEWYAVATRTLAVDCLGSDEEDAREKVSDVTRALVPGAVLSKCDTTGGELLSTSIRRASVVSDAYDKSRRALAKIAATIAMVTEPYWYGHESSLDTGTFISGAPSVTISAASCLGDVLPAPIITLSGLQPGSSYTLMCDRPGYGNVSFTASATTVTLTGSTATGTSALRVWAPFSLYGTSVVLTLTKVGGAISGSVGLVVTYQPRYLSA